MVNSRIDLVKIVVFLVTSSCESVSQCSGLWEGSVRVELTSHL